MTIVIGSANFPSDEYSRVSLHALGLGKALQAIGIKFTGCPATDADGTAYRAKIKQVVMKERDWREVTVSASSSYTGTAATIYAPETLAKVVEANVGFDRVYRESIASTSRCRALNAARYLMWQAIRSLQVKTYTTDNPPATIPERGDTVLMPDGYLGVVLARPGLRLRDGTETMTIRVLDMRGVLDT